MIQSINEELRLMICLIIFGIYLISTYDAVLEIEKWLKFKKIKTILIEVIFNLLQILITIVFAKKIANNNIPIYFILFFVFGIIIYYYTSRKYYLKSIHKILTIYKMKEPKIKKIFREFLYSDDLIKQIKKFLSRYKKLFKRKNNKKGIPKE